MKKFEIKSYGKSELACLYRPNVATKSALKTLSNWIRRNPNLRKELREAGYGANGTLTPLQVEIIVKYCGEP